MQVRFHPEALSEIRHTWARRGEPISDMDGDGVNEALGMSDDPATTGGDDPTAFVVSLEGVLEIPTLDRLGLLAPLLLLGGLGVFQLRRRLP